MTCCLNTFGGAEEGRTPDLRIANRTSDVRIGVQDFSNPTFLTIAAAAQKQILPVFDRLCQIFRLQCPHSHRLRPTRLTAPLSISGVVQVIVAGSRRPRVVPSKSLSKLTIVKSCFSATAYW